MASYTSNPENGWHRIERPGRSPICFLDEGKGEPLVLVHGVGGGADNWDGVVAHLSRGAPRFRTVRTIRMDLSGHGRSGPITAPCTAEDLARDVTDVMDEAGVRAATLAGFSLGGLIAQAIALDSPARVTRLALIATVAGRTPEEQARSTARIGVVRDKGLAEIAEGNRERWFTDEFRRRNPELVEARVQQLIASDPVSYLHAFAVFATGDFSARLAQIRVPTLIVAGELDIAATPRMAKLMHERISGSRLEILPGLRHSLLIEAPDRIAEMLDNFF